MGEKFQPGNNNDTSNASGKAEFIRFNSYRDIDQKRNSDTKPLKNSLSQRRIRATRLTLSLGILCTFEREQSVSCCSTGREKLDHLLLFNLYFWRNCYVTNVSSDNRNVQLTTQSLNSLSIPQPGAVYQHSVQQTNRHLKVSVSLCFTGRKLSYGPRFKIVLSEKLYLFCLRELRIKI